MNVGSAEIDTVLQRWKRNCISNLLHLSVFAVLLLSLTHLTPRSRTSRRWFCCPLSFWTVNAFPRCPKVRLSIDLPLRIANAAKLFCSCSQTRYGYMSARCRSQVFRFPYLLSAILNSACVSKGRCPFPHNSPLFHETGCWLKSTAETQLGWGCVLKSDGRRVKH